MTPPPDDHRCRRSNGNSWRCKELRFEGSVYCEKHQYKPDDKRCRRPNCKELKFQGNNLCEKHYNKCKEYESRRQKRKPDFTDDQRCRRYSNSGWQCKELRFQGTVLCKKHYNEQESRNQKRKMKGKMKDADFSEGQQVEVARADEGFKDSWFTANILKLPNVNSSKLKMVVEFENLLAKEKGNAHLKESVDPSHVRPVPPPQPPNQSFQLHQSVDALYEDGWWKGEVFEIHENNLYTVHFPAWKEFTEFGADKLREHLDWVGGRWVNPLYKKDDQRKKDIGPNTKLQREIGESSSSPITAPKRAMSTRIRTRSMEASDMINQHGEGVANQTITISETRGFDTFQFESILKDPQEKIPGTEVANVFQPECPLEGAELQLLSNTDDAPHSSAFSLPINPQSMDVGVNDSENRKRKIKKGKGRASKKLCNEEAPGGSLTDPIRTTPGRTTTVLAVETTRQSEAMLLESVEDFINKSPSRKAVVAMQTECPPEGSEIETLSNIGSRPDSLFENEFPTKTAFQNLREIKAQYIAKLTNIERSLHSAIAFNHHLIS